MTKRRTNAPGKRTGFTSFFKPDTPASSPAPKTVTRGYITYDSYDGDATVAMNAAPAEPELLLGRYKLEDEAGQGGFSSVVVAWDTRIQRQVAIKCMPLNDLTGATDPLSGSILVGDSPLNASQVPGLEEARTAAMLNDSTIVQVYDFEVQDNMAYLILEYVDGMTLGDLLSRFPQEIDADIAATVFKAVSHALQVAHKHQVLHLDIKPENVLINQQGQVKVTDFGLARLATEAGYGAAAGGTIGYMPPEQMRQEELDERCDEWALASLTYEMLARQNPFMADNLDDAETAIYDAELVIPSLCMEGVDESIDDIMFCALDPDPNERYDSVADFAEQLQPCLGSTRKGLNKLKRLVGRIDDAEEDAFDDYAEGEDYVYDDGAYYDAPEGYSRGLSDRARGALIRVWAALGAAVAAFLVVSNIGYLSDWSSPVPWLVALGMVVCAALFPHVGAAVSYIGIGIALCINGDPIPGAVLMVLAVGWWAAFGRTSHESGNVAMVPVLFGSFALAPLAPFAAGYFLKVRDAVFAALLAAAGALVLAGFGSMTLAGWDALQNHAFAYCSVTTNLATLVTTPSAWITLASWVVAALIASALGSFERRVWNIVGCVLAFAVLLLAVVLGSLADTAGAQLLVDAFSLVPVIISGVVALVFVSIALPYPRPRMQDEPYDYEGEYEEGYVDYE